MATRVSRRGRGFGRGGSFGGNASSSSSRRPGNPAAAASFDEEEQEEEAPEMAALRAKYGAEQLPQVKAVFPDWTDEDILIAVGEAGGLVEVAIGRIAEGHATQWGSVKSNKKPAKKDTPAPATINQQSTFNSTVPASNSADPSSIDSTAAATHPPARGGFRGRGRGEPTRGGRGGRGGFRGGVGRGGARGGMASQANGHAASGESAATTTSAEAAQPAQAQVPAPVKPAPVQSAWVNAVKGSKPKPVAASAPAPAPAEAEIPAQEIASGWEPVTVEETVITETPEAVTVTTVSTTEGEGISQVAVTETTVVEETASNETAAAPAVNGEEPSTQAEAPAPVKPKSSVRPGTSWASLLRKPPAPVPAPQPAAPAQAAPVIEAKVEIPDVVETASITATAAETEPLLSSSESTTTEAAPVAAAPAVAVIETVTVPAATVSSDPWASTPAAATAQHEEANEPTALPVGQGWADAVIAQEPTPSQEDYAQHQRAEEAVPAEQQQDQNDKMAGPPGLQKRTVSSRIKQDQPVVMPGSTPDLDRVGVQFGSLNLFGGSSELDNSAQQQQQQSSRALYETPSMLDDAQVEQQQQQQPAQQQQSQAIPHEQPVHQTSSYQTDSNQFGGFQQASQQLPPPSSQQAHSLYNGASAYANRYQQTQAPYGQQTQHADPFASLSGNYNVNSGLASQYSQPQLGGLGGHDAISPYLSAQQQQQQAQPAAQPSVGAPSPAPASTRDVGIAAPQTGSAAASAYGGFTSAVNQAPQQQQQQQQHPSGYPTDYASLYGLQQQQQDPMRNFGGFYNQYDQQSRNTAGTDDVTSKLGGAGGNQQQSQTTQQQHQQHAAYAQHNMMPYGYPPYYGMHPNYPQYNSYGGYPSHSPYAPYPGYGAPGGGARGYPGQQGNQGGYRGMQQQQQQQQQQGGYGSNAQGGGNLPHPTAYGNAAYGSFDNSRLSGAGVGSQSNQGVSNTQDARNSSTKDVFGDRFFGGNY